jgi:subtilisin family serine protease
MAMWMVAVCMALTVLVGDCRVVASPAAARQSQGVPWDDVELLGKFDPTLLKQLVSGQAGLQPVIVQMKAQAKLESAARPGSRAFVVESLRSTADISQREVRAFLAAEEVSGRASDVKPLWVVNAVSVRAAPETLWQLAARPDVSFVRADRWMQWLDPNLDSPTSDLQLPTSSIQWGIGKIRADQAWAAFNITGTGVVVANLDTGVDWLHPALNGNYRGCTKGICQHATSWFDATPTGALYPMDGHGHGTHTMGTLAGQGGIGVAPGAQWIAARVLDSTGSGFDSWIHEGFQWILAPGGDPAMAPRVVSNSWGSDLGNDMTFQNDVRALRAAGILPVFSNGTKANPGTVGSPASLPESFAVGAMDGTDRVASFSSRGPSVWGRSGRTSSHLASGFFRPARWNFRLSQWHFDGRAACGRCGGIDACG